ncbi:MAG: hypothetical protein US50_C0053G0004 [Candidatus Nomurabacteria bacterium GW2011_GWB1_37_5]|uniref:Uncharacterized protein n=1 Tax=Candidatus Nomurabacteria bacterium GW2011_GWB1_37_5 TaxID=1618742 RepID=A0A0G0GTC6_9BACT|nr:MAG: hypothetical protein US50_C0053G0004 [Candidatus Nomurabacteria bacterium GW2011_GWB1_37_5]
MTPKQVQDMKSWPEETLKLFFSEIFRILRKTIHYKNKSDYYEFLGTIIYYGNLLFSTGFILSFKSKTGQHKMYSSFVEIFDICPYPCSWGKSYHDLEKKILEYESERLKIVHNPYLQSNMEKRKKRIDVRIIMENFELQAGRTHDSTMEILTDDFLQKICKINVIISDPVVCPALIRVCSGNINYLRCLIAKLDNLGPHRFKNGLGLFYAELHTYAQKYNYAVCPKINSMLSSFSVHEKINQ